MSSSMNHPVPRRLMRGLLFLGPSGHSLLIAAAALGAEKAGKGVDRGARIGMGVEAATPWGAEAAPMADEEGAAE
jgi:hypothetical protein